MKLCHNLSISVRKVNESSRKSQNSHHLQRTLNRRNKNLGEKTKKTFGLRLLASAASALYSLNLNNFQQIIEWKLLWASKGYPAISVIKIIVIIMRNEQSKELSALPTIAPQKPLTTSWHHPRRWWSGKKAFHIQRITAMIKSRIWMDSGFVQQNIIAGDVFNKCWWCNEQC